MRKRNLCLLFGLALYVLSGCGESNDITGRASATVSWGTLGETEKQAPRREPERSEVENVISGLDPAQVKAEIMAAAAKRWKDDNTMQLFIMKEQTESYNRLVAMKVDSSVKSDVLKNVRKRWQWDFIMIEFEYDMQMEAYAKINQLNIQTDNHKKILDAAFARWKNDYEMVLFEYNEQLEAYDEIQKLKK